METDKAKVYHAGKKRIFYLGLGLDVVVLLGLCMSGASLWLRLYVDHLTTIPFLVKAIYIIFFCLVLYLFQFPLNLFSDFIWEHRFSLSRQTLGAWLKDEVKKGFFSLALFLIMVEAVYFLLGKFSDSWWIWAATFWLFLSLFLARIMPNVIIPLFYKYVKVENEDLRQKIFSLFAKCKVTLKEVYAIKLSEKTKKANAFVCGLGKSRRVVLSDTLIADFSVDEIETVVAHELGHYQHRDIVKLTAINSIMIFGAFFFMDFFLKISLSKMGLAKSDIAGLPIFILGMVVFGLVTTPFLNAFSRFLERAADRFSLEVTGKREEFISMMDKLGKMNLAEFSPSRFDEIMFYDHPPIAQRIEMAKKFQNI